MAVYKVPQDVEADDKLIGPFSFRQFIYLIVVAISMAGAWGLSQLFIPLAIIPLPIIIFFAALALPLRKDQPMEAYLSAVVSFYFLKSRKRFWIPDGIDSFVTIIPPKDADRILTKDLNEDEATKRLGYLADLVDTHGWAIRGAGTVDTSINKDLYYESQQTPDMYDASSPAAQKLAQQLDKGANAQKKEAITNMKAAAKTAPAKDASTTSSAAAAQTTPTTDEEPKSTLPSLEEIRAKQNATESKQSKKDTLDAITLANALTEQVSDERGVPAAKPTPEKATTSTSASTPDAGTMVLTQKQANELSEQKDVSVLTLSKEANRVAEKNKVLKSGDEVTISFH
ncbi:MAG: hypothetical protein JWO07_585 [Candidatus Saccharibacteria bacterium]|nr:hypothetical protein [Candidatus Saccharibacteria bacterium]